MSIFLRFRIPISAKLHILERKLFTIQLHISNYMIVEKKNSVGIYYTG